MIRDNVINTYGIDFYPTAFEFDRVIVSVTNKYLALGKIFGKDTSLLTSAFKPYFSRDRKIEKRMWQWRQSRQQPWQTYSDIESSMIEDVYNHGGQRVELENNVLVDVKKGLHIVADSKKNDKPAEIRRLSLDCEDAKAYRNRAERNDRFTLPPQIMDNTNDSSSLGAGNWNGSRLVFEWHMRCSNLESLPYGDIMRQALDGIQIEGKAIGQAKQAQWIADHWIPVTKESFEYICRACIHLYTMESFLYRLVNATLRNNDFSKIDTLGPFCYLLFQFNFAPEYQNLRFSGRVYRSAELTPAMVNEYKQAVGKVRSWLGLTSTSRQRAIAESFCAATVLFIIDIQETATDAARLIASLSAHPYEDEVLIRAGRHFTIDRVEPNKSSNNNINTLIYLTIE
ncbi:unnamed protein product [Rotaria sordida]|uniref:NAD(P)(+)--arginine ADP-ribosyltransferase n=1 Tax=Rotaria sordida TaxID=392033 RepID=A0A815N1I6_9BILA|nr:unnamed protein product [Rotaria sordida]